MASRPSGKAGGLLLVLPVFLRQSFVTQAFIINVIVIFIDNIRKCVHVRTCTYIHIQVSRSDTLQALSYTKRKCVRQVFYEIPKTFSGKIIIIIKIKIKIIIVFIFY